MFLFIFLIIENFVVSKQLTYLLITLFLLSCCKRHVVEDPVALIDAEIINADSILQLSPGSALEYLMSSRDSLESKSLINTHYHALLTSEALFKTDNPQYFPDELHSAMLFFDSLALLYPGNKSLPLLSARSHYMEGVVLLEDDNPIGACKEYLNTLKIMEDAYDEKDLVGYKAKFMGLTHTRLGGLFFDYGTAQPAIEFYRYALMYFTKLSNFSLSNTYRRIGCSYRLDNNKDTALFYYRKALSLSEAENKLATYGASLTEISSIYYELGYSDSAYLMIRKALMLPMNENQRITRYHTIGVFYEKDHIYDSAIFYLEKSVNSKSDATRTVSAESLMNCYQAIGDSSKMKYYKNMYGEQLDKYRNALIIEEDLDKIYEAYKLCKQHEANVFYKKRNRTISIIVLLIFVVISTILYCVIIKYVKIKKTLQDDIESKNKALAQMKRKIETNPFVTEPICKYILDVVNENSFKAKVDFRIYKEFALNKNQIMMLRDAVDRHYNNFTQTLCKKFPDLTIDDIDYCCFYLLGLKEADISALIQRAYSTVYQRSQKLKRIFNTTESLHSAVATMVSKLSNNT